MLEIPGAAVSLHSRRWPLCHAVVAVGCVPALCFGCTGHTDLLRAAVLHGTTQEHRGQVRLHPYGRARGKLSCLIALEQCHPEELGLRLEQIQAQLQDVKRELLNGASHVGKKHTSILETIYPSRMKSPCPAVPECLSR